MQVVLPARAIDQLKRESTVDWDTIPQMGRKRIELYGGNDHQTGTQGLGTNQPGEWRMNT